jgi:hypothetical protein
MAAMQVAARYGHGLRQRCPMIGSFNLTDGMSLWRQQTISGVPPTIKAARSRCHRWQEVARLWRLAQLTEIPVKWLGRTR